MLEVVALFVFPAMMAYAASSDLLTMTIPNRLTAAVFLTWGAFALTAQAPLADIWMSLACGAMVLLVTFGMFCMGWMGGGDAKLAAATSVWLGWPLVLEYLLLASVLGGALTLLIIFARQTPLPAPLIRHAWIARLHDAKTGIPFGIALAAAALILFPQSPAWELAVTSAQ